MSLLAVAAVLALVVAASAVYTVVDRSRGRRRGAG
jgi:hypothetical protein